MFTDNGPSCTSIEGCLHFHSKISAIKSLTISDEATRIAELLLSQHAVLKGSEEDALHIGIAAAQGADYLLT